MPGGGTLFQIVPIPVDGGLDALLEIPFRGISEALFRFADVRAAVLDVSGTFGSENGLRIYAERVQDGFVNVQQAVSRPP